MYYKEPDNIILEKKMTGRYIYARCPNILLIIAIRKIVYECFPNELFVNRKNNFNLNVGNGKYCFITQSNDDKKYKFTFVSLYSALVRQSNITPQMCHSLTGDNYVINIIFGYSQIEIYKRDDRQMGVIFTASGDNIFNAHIHTIRGNHYICETIDDMVSFVNDFVK